MTDRREKAAASMMEGLQNKQQKKPGKAVQVSEIKKRIQRIKERMEVYHEIKRDIVEDLIYLRANQEQLQAETGKTFQDILEETTGFSKSHFYGLIKAYNLCLEYNAPETFDKTDTWMLNKLAGVKDEKFKTKLFKQIDGHTRYTLQAEIKEHESDRRTDKVIDADYTVHTDIDGTVQALKKALEARAALDLKIWALLETLRRDRKELYDQQGLTFDQFLEINGLSDIWHKRP